MMSSARPKFVLWAWCLWMVLRPVAAFAVGGDEVLVIYNTRVPASRSVAEHYAKKRSVPEENLVGFEMATGGSISRGEYVKSLQDPLREWMESHGFAKWTSEKVPGKGGSPAGTKYTLTSSKVRYLLLCYGVPWYIQQDSSLKESTNGLPDAIQRNDACLDHEICLLPRLGHYQFIGMTVNPFGSLTNAAMIQPTNGAFIVSRLDGPTPEIAMGLVDKALDAEIKGLWGHAYIDLRDIREGAYARGETMITNAASAAKRLGFETFVDNKPELFPTGYPLSEVGIYVGWYSQSVVGPFAQPTVEFMPGAFAYHLHSFSAANIRSADLHWVGPMLSKGVTCTMGCVAEPYLDFTPHPGVFLERWGYLGMTFGEAAMTAHPTLSWQTVVIGDPLYRPFRLNPLQYGQMLEMANDPRVGYAMVRRANVNLMLGQPPDQAREQLEGTPMATNNAVVAEKVARLLWKEVRVRKAIEWYEKAAGMPNCTPRQKLRLLLDMAEAQKVLDRPRDAYATLEKVLQTEPGYVDWLKIRNQQLQLAREMRDAAKTDAINAEIHRLTSPPPTNAPTK